MDPPSLWDRAPFSICIGIGIRDWNLAAVRLSFSIYVVYSSSINFPKPPIIAIGVGIEVLLLYCSKRFPFSQPSTCPSFLPSDIVPLHNHQHPKIFVVPTLHLLHHPRLLIPILPRKIPGQYTWYNIQAGKGSHTS